MPKHHEDHVFDTHSGRSARVAVVLGALLALGSCQGDTTILLRIEGSAPGGQELKLRVVDTTGPLPNTFTFPESGKAFTLPGTIDFQVPSSQRRLGVFVWVQNNNGGVLAQARSFACFKVAANASNTATLTLQPAAPAFSPNSVQDCKCNGDLDMCDPSLVGNTGGNGNMGGAGGAVGGSGGTSPMAGAGGNAPNTGGQGGVAIDGGTSMMDAAMMGGTAGMDAAAKPDAAPVVTNGLFAFDTPGDWTSAETTVSQDTAEKNQGTASLSFTVDAGKSAYIRSRPFATAEVPGATTKLGLSVHIPAAQTNQANIQMWFECVTATPRVDNAYIQYKSLAGLAVGWNQLTFDLPPKVVEALQGQNTGCKFWMDHQAGGTFRYDNLGFL